MQTFFDEYAAPLVKEGLKGMCILLVEDAPDSRHLLERFLVVAGAMVDTAEDGAEALVLADIARHDVILMDIQMPVMDGFVATRALRARGFHRPIIALTASAQPWELSAASEARFDAYLTKPITQRALVNALCTWMLKN